MKTHLYLSLIPESLIASMLPPVEFGAYFATGTQRRSRGRAIFFEVHPDKLPPETFPVDKLKARCVPHSDGRPRKSSYLSIYRVLEKVPLAALGKLYLTTDDGRTLGLEPEAWSTPPGRGLHLYQELGPVMPRVVSTEDPESFARLITDPANPVNVPVIVFCELILRGLAEHPESAPASDLPYANIGHLRDCLASLLATPGKQVKTVVRSWSEEMLYRTVKNGFFICDGKTLLHYAMPSRDQLEREYYEWWRSACSAFGG